MSNHLADKFEEMADVVPLRLALVDDEQRVTYGELERRSNRFAHYLQLQGVRREDSIGLIARNSVAFVVAFLGAFKLGAVPVNMNFRYVAAELLELFNDSGARVLVVDEDLAEECAQAIASSDQRFHVIVIGAEKAILGAQSVTYDSAMSVTSSERNFEPRSGDDIHVIYTGGTTGRPKGVEWRHEDTYFLASNGKGTDAALEAARNDPNAASTVTMPIGPFVHSSAQWVLIGGLIGGRTIVVLNRFDADHVWRLCEREQVQLLVITGDATARPLLESLGPDGLGPTSVKVIQSTGAMLSPTTKSELARAFPQAIVLDSLGSTETGLLGSSPASRNLPSAELRVDAQDGTIVLDDNGDPVAVGQTGMLAKTGFIPLRYRNDPDKTAKTFVIHKGRRYAIPGDVARVEADGTITVLGRQSSCINTGGEKVYPNEVEGVLMSCAAVADCLVVGVPDRRWGQLVCALVQPVQGRVITLDDLQAHARRELAGYKIPRVIHLVERVERQPSGKPDYRWAAEVTKS